MQPWSGDSSLSRTDEALAEMSNGCICCTLREDLLVEVGRLAEEGRFDYLVIESTGTLANRCPSRKPSPLSKRMAAVSAA